MIKSIPSDNHNEFYENEYINALVDLSLDNLDDNIFFCILHVIQYGNLTFAVEIIDEFKLESSQKDSYDYLKTIVQSIYEDEINKDNLRGAYLELLVYKFLNNKYSNYSCYRSDLDCYVEIFGNRSDRTVDVFAFWLNEGFVSENKISERFFEEHDIENLNWIYT